MGLSGPDSQHILPGSLYLWTPPLGVPAIFQDTDCQGVKEEEKYQVVFFNDPDSSQMHLLLAAESQWR